MSQNVRIHRIIRGAISIGILWLLMLIPVAARAQNLPKSFNELVAQANSARKQNNLADAINLYQKAVQRKPDWPPGWWYLGSLQYGMHAYEPAIRALSHYINLTPKAAPAYALRGLCEFEVGQYPASLQDLQQAIALGAANNPRNAGVLVFHEALLLTRLGHFQKSLTKYKVLIEHGAASQNVITGLGLAGLRMPILPKDLEPSQINFVSQIGVAAADVMGGQLTRAHQAFQAIFYRYPHKRNIHYLYGYLLSIVDPIDAIAQFRDELKISPKSALANSMLAWDLGTQGHYHQALRYARNSVQENPSLPMAQLVMGKDLVETGHMAASLPYLKALIKRFPRNLEAHLALVKAYSNLGRTSEARQQRLLCLAISKKRAITPDAEL